jgi:hypothetical protein
MKTADEIQRAHDLYWHIFAGYVPSPRPDDPVAAVRVETIVAALGWVLDWPDDESTAVFEANTQALFEWVRARGYRMSKAAVQ